MVLAGGAVRVVTWRKKPHLRGLPVGARRSQTQPRCPVSLRFRAGRPARVPDLALTLARTCAMRALANLVCRWGLLRRASADRKRKRNAASTRTTSMDGAAVRSATSQWLVGSTTVDGLATKACAVHARFPSKLAAIVARALRIFHAMAWATRRAAYGQRRWTMDHQNWTNGRACSIAASLAAGRSTAGNTAARSCATLKTKQCRIAQEVRM